MSFKSNESPFLKKQASEMVKGLEVLATKPDDVSLVPKTHVVKENSFPQVLFWPPRMYHDTRVHTIVYMYKTCCVLFLGCLSVALAGPQFTM